MGSNERGLLGSLWRSLDGVTEADCDDLEADCGDLVAISSGWLSLREGPGGGWLEFSHFPRRRGRQSIQVFLSLAHWQFLHLPVLLQRQQQGIVIDFECVKYTRLETFSNSSTLTLSKAL